VRILYWVVTIVVAFFLVVFAISNLRIVPVEFGPFGREMPLWFVVLVAAVFGFLFGELVAWLGGRRWRRDARAKARRVEALERELAATQAQLRPAAPGTRLAVTGAPRD
jgi:uncharacterized integral membrane protein